MIFFKMLAFIGPVLIPVVVSLFLFFDRKRSRAKAFLGILMLNLSFAFFCNFFYFEKDYAIYAYLHSLHVASVLLIYPSVYIYILLLTQGKVRWKQAGAHFIPALFFGVVSASIFYFFLEPGQRLTYLTNYRFDHHFDNVVLKIFYFLRILNVACLFIQIPLYFFLSGRQLKTHRRIVEDSFSDVRGFDLVWIRNFNIAFFLAAVASISFYAINPAKNFGNDIYLIIPLYLLSLIMCVFGIMGNNQEIVAMAEPPAEKVIKNPELLTSLEKLLSEKKVFLQKGVKITDLAFMLNTNRTYLSQEINNNYKLNFNQLINLYRIEEAKRILKSPQGQKVTLGEVAELCGWGSLSSLNRAFKNAGMSPTEFRKKENGFSK